MAGTHRGSATHRKKVREEGNAGGSSISNHAAGSKYDNTIPSVRSVQRQVSVEGLQYIGRRLERGEGVGEEFQPLQSVRLSQGLQRGKGEKYENMKLLYLLYQHINR